MKRILGWTINFLVLPVAVLIGNWLGGELRYALTGVRLQTIQFRTTTRKGRKLANLPVATKFIPGLCSGLIGKPRWLFAWIGGLLAGGLVPDPWEQIWLERVIEPLIIDRVLGEGQASVRLPNGEV